MPGSTVTTGEPGGSSEHARVRYIERSRTRSGGSASVHSQPSSGGSGARSSTGSGSGSWHHVEPPYDDADEEDDIEPSDSASRARRPSTRRPSEIRPAVSRRHSSRRVAEPDIEEPPSRPRRHRSHHRHQSSRLGRRDSHRAPSDESSLGTVASHDEYYYGHQGMGPPPRAYPAPQSGYRHVPAPGPGGYPPSIAPSGAPMPDGYGTRQLVHMPQQDPYGYPINPGNPFTPPDPQQNPFSPMSQASGGSYFAMDPHAPQMHPQRPQHAPRPQSYAAPSSHYGSDMISPYGHHPMGPYPGYPHMPGYPMPGWYPPPSNHSSPPPAAEKEEKKGQEMEAIQAILQKTEEARLAWHKEMIAKAEADAAAATEKRLREEEEKRKKEEIADATKKARESAEKKAEDAAKKAKEDADKKLAEAEQAKEEAVKKQKELEAEKEKLTPPDDAGKVLKFKDAMDRKFSFPYRLCKTWKGMEGLIKQAFMQIDVIGDHVRAGHYDLTGPDGEIILPQVWENMVQPDWEIEMHMWPMEEDQPKKKKGNRHETDALPDFASLGLGDLDSLGIVPPGRKKSKKDGAGAKKKAKSTDPMIMVPPGFEGIPPPPGHHGYPPGMMPDPFGLGPMFPLEKEKKAKSKAKNSGGSSLAAWFAGSSAPVKKKK